MTISEIRAELKRLQDIRYREMQIRIIPTVRPETIIGVRTPELRRMAEQFSGTEETNTFLNDLPHSYFEENKLHAFILSGMKDYAECVRELNRFLPYVDNWATCDQMSPRVFRKHRKELQSEIMQWIRSDKAYTVRFGVGMLMQHFLKEDFDTALAGRVADLRSEEYYVNMMRAWYFATALAGQYEAVLPFIENRKLDPWTHNRAIQKACESFRVSPERKEYLKSLKIPGEKKRGGKKPAGKGK
jgi:3-methyladenine DNA glycosylase AlkD